MKRWRMLAILLCFWTALVFSHPRAHVADTLAAHENFRSAGTFYNSARYDSALYYSQKALADFTAAAEKTRAAKTIARTLDCRSLYSKSLIRLRSFDDAMASIKVAEEWIARYQKSLTPQQADLYVCYGSWYNGRNDHSKAIESFLQAASAYRTLNGDSSLFIARVYDLIGSTFHSKGDYNSSLAYLEKSANIIRFQKGNDSPEYGENCASTGVVLYDRGEYEKATTMAETALQLRKKHLGDIHIKVAESWQRLGVCWYARGDYDRALACYEEGARVIRALFGEQNAHLAQYWNNRGIIHFEKGYFDRALDDFTRGLDLKRQTMPASDPSIANSFNNVGNVHYMRGDYDQALDFYRQALALRRQAYKENHPVIAGSYQKIGSAYQLRGDLDLALQYFDQSLAISLKAYGENHVEVTRCYEMMSSLYLRKGEPAAALVFAQKALTIDSKVLGEQHPLVATRHNKVADMFSATGQHDSALAHYNKGIDLLVARHGERYYMIGHAHQDLGDLHVARQEWSQALLAYDRADSLLSAAMGTAYPALTVIDRRRAMIYMEQKEWRKAFAQIQAALGRLSGTFHPQHYHDNPAPASLPASRAVVDVLAQKGRALEEYYRQVTRNKGDLRACLQTCTLAADLLDHLLDRYEGTESKLETAEEVHFIYDRGVRTAMQLWNNTGENSYLQTAFVMCEKAKSAVLWHLVQETQARRFAGIPDSLLNLEREIRADITFYETRQQKEQQKGLKTDSLRLREYRDKLFAAHERHRLLRDRFGREYPEYAQLFQDARPLNIASLQAGMNEGTALLDYYMDSANTLYCFTVTRKGLDGSVTAIDSNFVNTISALTRSIKKMDKGGFLSHSHRLHEKLLRPQQKNLAAVTRLLIIPHGELYKVPFEALLQKPVKAGNANYSSLPYLINGFDISYHYSALLYRHGMEKERGASLRPERGDFLGFAPVFRDSTRAAPVLAELRSRSAYDSSYRSISIDGRRFNELRYSEDEVQTIMALFEQQNKKATGYMHDQATEKQFKASAGAHRLVHVATHGLINESVPQLSGLIFSPDTDHKEDGVLYAAETFNLALDADLLVLGSCESGMGTLRAGEGLMSLTRGFLFSGARRVLVSLWKISDRHTRDFMAAFYADLLADRSCAAAARTAKLAMIKNPATASPNMWSGFILIGD